MEVSALKIWMNDSLKGKYDGRTITQLSNLLLEHHTGWNRSQQQVNANEKLEEGTIQLIKDGVALLLKDMPIDYITGMTYFYGYPLKVDQNVLIPRSETEELVQLIIEREHDLNSKILDIGTGSGCIPIALALEGKYEHIDACDVSIPALEIAKLNAGQLEANINFFQLNILTTMPKNCYDIIVSNPPYVKQEEMENLDSNVKDYEPRIALTPEEDPLLFYKVMLQHKAELLKPNGRMYWEIHEDLGQEVVALMENANFKDIELLEDMFGRDRFVIGTYID